MTAAHDFELPPDGNLVPPAALDAAEHGQVVYLTRNGEQVAAIVPADVAAAGTAAIEALEEAEDIRAARAALADPAPSIPMADIRAEHADDLAAYPDTDHP
ncbi:hypothetical protein GCM10012275_55230 [Longimycelium tulufanense]|uniref:Antitoxin n=1 Tax=Longimycelium tulufanense TaxID=907463 RepID=A0A8J3CJQ2_9PSEU|nr:prevent-host-death protein [Longimycelium tulufanense]GGM77473.1 hypothetical protein GCM10012275_55230 [Longimycelium tulufanense]